MITEQDGKAMVGCRINTPTYNFHGLISMLPPSSVREAPLSTKLSRKPESPTNEFVVMLLLELQKYLMKMLVQSLAKHCFGVALILRRQKKFVQK